MTTVAVISDNPHIQAAYERCLANGCAPRLAEMLAFRAAPKALTDREFLEGQGTLQKQFEGEEQNLEKLTKIATKHGRRPNPNDVYVPFLAAYPGDPKAFVPSTDARGHIAAVCKERGTACHGAVEVKARPAEPKERKGKQLASDLVDREVKAAIAVNPDNARRKDLREEIIDKHGA